LPKCQILPKTTLHETSKNERFLYANKVAQKRLQKQTACFMSAHSTFLPKKTASVHHLIANLLRERVHKNFRILLHGFKILR